MPDVALVILLFYLLMVIGITSVIWLPMLFFYLEERERTKQLKYKNNGKQEPE